MRIGLLLGMAVVAGCRGKGPAPEAVAGGPASAPPASEPRTGAGPLTSDESKDLCLSDPGGRSPRAETVRALQARARARLVKPDDWVSLGREWVRQARLTSDPGFYVNVGACAAVALAQEPDHPAGLALRSLVLMNDHEFDQARRVAQRILLRDPEDPMALGTLSDAWLEMGRYDEAALAAQRLANVRPGMAAYSRGSYLRWIEGDDRRARVLIREALYGRDARDPEPAAWTFVEAATLFWHLGDYEGADAVYAEALRWVPDYPSALVGRARVALARAQPRQALDHLEKAYRIRPLAETAWLLGDARQVLGDLEGAQQAYEHVVQQGRRGDALTLALFFATKDRDHDEALRLIEKERAGRGGVHVDDTYAWALFRAGRIEEARKASDRAIRLGTKEARLLYHAGAIRMAAGDDGGRRLVRRAVALNPGFDWTGAAEARRLLEAAPKKLAAN
jgi:tetratricopeptide (TPR) repeat protein